MTSKSKKIGYARCSTANGKQDVERQERDLRSRGVESVYSEYASGADPARPQLSRALDSLHEGDTLHATEVSRLTRRLAHLLHIIDHTAARKAKLAFGSIEFDFTQNISAMHLAMLQMMGIFAELERNIGRERIGSGLRNAKANGKKLGRPKTTPKDIPLGIRKTIAKNNHLPKTALAKLCGISRPTLNKYMSLLKS